MATTRIVIESKKWYAEAKDLVRNFEFDLNTVYDNTGRGRFGNIKNCQFCGQAIRYVAIIHGHPKNATTKTPVVKHIGCDCLERVLGNTWHHYNQAMTQYKTLVEAAKVESRKEKYAEKYAEYIKWLQNVPTFIQNVFLKDMLRILTTGAKTFSPNMEKYLLWHKNNPKFNGAEAVRQSCMIDTQKQKTKDILTMVEKIDGKNIHTKYSAYGFVNSVLNSIDRQNGLTNPQMDALNKVFLRYTKSRVVPTILDDDKAIPY